MQIGGMLALLSIYVILAWVFASWTRPFAVMIMIPFGLIGAVVGHYFMGLSMNILSLFALIALSGIVVNNSIILVATIERRIVGLKGDVEKAIIQGSIDRLRPVLLTSMTTIGGLSALMFETSLQAQFLIPMATTIVFGLAVTTCLVLFLVPATLGIGRDIEKFISQSFQVYLIFKNQILNELNQIYFLVGNIMNNNNTSGRSYKNLTMGKKQLNKVRKLKPSSQKWVNFLTFLLFFFLYEFFNQMC